MKIFIIFFFIQLSFLFADFNSTNGVLKFKSQLGNEADMILSGTGLGIGTTPASNLHVNGNVYITQKVNLGQNQGDSTLNVHGSIGFNYETITSSTTLSDNTLILVNPSSDNIILTLPSASQNEGKLYQIKRTIDNTNFVRISSNDNIDNSSDDFDLPGLNSIHFVSDGSSWFIMTEESSARQIIASENLLGWWKLDETSGNTVTDASNNQNHGIYNGTIESVHGPIGTAIDFDGGSEQIDIPNESFFDISDAITLSCWIKVDNLDTVWQAILTKGDSSWRLHRNSTGNTINWTCTGLSGSASLTTTTEVNDGKWHHVVASFDGSTQYLYLDGILESSSARTGTISLNNYTVAIGENIQQNTREWEGAIDDVRIYNIGLTASQIFKLYDQGR